MSTWGGMKAGQVHRGPRLILKNMRANRSLGIFMFLAFLYGDHFQRVLPLAQHRRLLENLQFLSFRSSWDFGLQPKNWKPLKNYSARNIGA